MRTRSNFSKSHKLSNFVLCFAPVSFSTEQFNFVYSWTGRDVLTALLVVEAFQLTWQTDLFTPSTTISVRHFQRKKNTVQWNSTNAFFKKVKMCFSTQRQRNIFQTFGRSDCPNQSPPDCRAPGLTNGNTMIFARKAFGLGKLGVKCCIIRKRKCLHVVWLDC